MVRTHSGCPPPPAQIVQPLVWRTVRSNSEPRIQPIVVGRAARDHRGGVGDQLADDLDRLRRRGDDDARIRPKPQPEHQHVPRLWIPPGGYFITPRCIVLRPPQALRLVGAVGCRNGPVRPGQPALCWLVLRPLLRWPDRQQAALAFDHDIAGIGCGRRDQRDPAAAVRDDLVANTLRTAAGLAKAATGHKLGRNKTDKVDAALICEYAELFKPEPWTPPSPAMRRLG